MLKTLDHHITAVEAFDSPGLEPVRQTSKFYKRVCNFKTLAYPQCEFNASLPLSPNCLPRKWDQL